MYHLFQGFVDYEAGGTFVETGSQASWPGIFCLIGRGQEGFALYNDGSLALSLALGW